MSGGRHAALLNVVQDIALAVHTTPAGEHQLVGVRPAIQSKALARNVGSLGFKWGVALADEGRGVSGSG